MKKLQYKEEEVISEKENVVVTIEFPYLSELTTDVINVDRTKSLPHGVNFHV